MASDVRFPVTMTEEQRDKLKVVAVLCGMTMNQFVLNLLLPKLAEFDLPSHPRKAAPSGSSGDAHPEHSKATGIHHAIIETKNDASLNEMYTIFNEIRDVLSSVQEQLELSRRRGPDAARDTNLRREREIETKAIVSVCLPSLKRLFKHGEQFSIDELRKRLRDSADRPGMLRLSQVKKLDNKKLRVMLTMRDKANGFFESHEDDRGSIRAPSGRRSPKQPRTGRTSSRSQAKEHSIPEVGSRGTV